MTRDSRVHRGAVTRDSRVQKGRDSGRDSPVESAWIAPTLYPAPWLKRRPWRSPPHLARRARPRSRLIRHHGLPDFQPDIMRCRAPWLSPGARSSPRPPVTVPASQSLRSIPGVRRRAAVPGRSGGGRRSVRREGARPVSIRPRAPGCCVLRFGFVFVCRFVLNALALLYPTQLDRSSTFLFMYVCLSLFPLFSFS